MDLALERSKLLTVISPSYLLIVLVLLILSRHGNFSGSELFPVQIFENLFIIGLRDDDDLLGQQNANELSHISLINQPLAYLH
jgi:hypothetical protein